MCVCGGVHVNVSTYMCMYVCTYICVYVYGCMCVWVPICVCMHLYVSAYVWVCWISTFSIYTVWILFVWLLDLWKGMNPTIAACLGEGELWIKPLKLCLKIDLVSHLACAECLVNRYNTIFLQTGFFFFLKFLPFFGKNNLIDGKNTLTIYYGYIYIYMYIYGNGNKLNNI